MLTLSDDKEKMAALEALVDNHSLTAVLNALSQICSDKAEHIRANWQDDSTAKRWDRACVKVGALSTKILNTEGI